MANQAKILLVGAVLISLWAAAVTGQDGQSNTPQSAIDSELAETIQNARSLLNTQDFKGAEAILKPDEDLFVEKTRIIQQWVGEAAGDQFGWTARKAGDIDGHFLLAIGAQNAGTSNRGLVYVYQVKDAKPELKFQIEGDKNSVNLGQMFICFPGDLNRDSVPDVYASDFSDNTKAKGGGKVVVHSGADGKQLLVIHGDQPGEGLGTSPSDAGDVDGDGIGDLVIGAWQNKQGAPSGGKIYLYSCAGKGKLLRTWTCKQAGDTLGFDATGIGDVDGDGHIDFLLTSAWSNKNGPKSGRVFIVAGEEHKSAAKTDCAKKQSRKNKNRTTRIGGLTQKKIEAADVSALFIGNSHTWNLHKMIERLFAEAHPEIKACIARAPGNGFLVDHARDKKTRKLIELGQWDFVILQAQKYSTTGRYSYPYDGALELSKLAQENGSKIIMFPEWSRRDVPDEHLRIDKIHHEIAAQTGAIVAPIGDCWDSVLESDPGVNLYAADGNHASEMGAYLNACVFYSLLAGEEAPAIKKSNDGAQLKLLRQTAWKHVASKKAKGADDE